MNTKILENNRQWLSLFAQFEYSSTVPPANGVRCKMWKNFPCSFPISLIFVSVTIKRRITSFVFIFPILISVPLKGPISLFLSVLQLNVELLHFLLIDLRAVKFVLLFPPPFLEDCFVKAKMLNYQEFCFQLVQYVFYRNFDYKFSCRSHTRGQ